MKRDPRLRGLSSEHHQALVLARSLTDQETIWTEDDGARLRRRFDEEIDPHFCIEDEVLLPALRSVGALHLAARTADDHAFLRGQVEAARSGSGDAAHAFGARLTEHVRFEERDLFPACETLLPDEVLDEVLRRCSRGDR